MITLKERVVNIRRPQETKEESRVRIFNYYKAKLKELANDHNEILYNYFEELCKYPKINPFEMLTALLGEGYKILFDNTSRCS